MSQQIIHRHASVIDALKPYAAKGKINRGLMRFQSRLPRQHLTVIRNEVLRLCEECKLPASNEAFAVNKLSCKTLRPGVTVTLDSVGEHIFKSELSKFDENYTVGVYEAVTSEKRYRSTLKALKQKQLRDKLTITSAPVNREGPFGEYPMKPKFRITSELLSEEPVTIDKLTSTEIEVTAFSNSQLSEGRLIPVSFGADGPFNQATTLQYLIKRIKGNVKRDHSVKLTLALKSGQQKYAGVLNQYIVDYYRYATLPPAAQAETIAHQFSRDQALNHSQWLPILCTDKQGEIIPHHYLVSDSNQSVIQSLFQDTGNGVCRRTWSELMADLKKQGDTYLIRCWHQTGNKRMFLSATLNRALAFNALPALIKKGLSNGSLQILKCHLAPISPTTQEAAGQLPYNNESASEQLANSTHILYFQDVSRSISLSPPEILDRGLPEAFVEGRERIWRINMLLSESRNQRCEERYNLNMNACVHTRLFTRQDAEILDFSASGLRVAVGDMRKLEPGTLVKISCKRLELRKAEYQLIETHNGVARFYTSKASVQKSVKHVIRANRLTLQRYSSDEQMQTRYRLAWELSCRHLPGVSVLAQKQSQSTPLLSYAIANPLYSAVLTPFLSSLQVELFDLFSDPLNKTAPSERLRAFAQQPQATYINYFYINVDKRSVRQFELPRYMNSPYKSQLIERIASERGDIRANIVNVLTIPKQHKLLGHAARADKRIKAEAMGELSKNDRLITITPVGELIKACVSQRIPLRQYS